MSHYNINHETGVAYGVINLRSIDPDLAQELWYTYGHDTDYDDALKEALREALADWIAEHGDDEGFDLGRAEQEFNDSYQNDEPTIEGEYKGTLYTIMHLGGAPLLYVRLSSHIVDDAPECSPCVPNAGDLDSYLAGGRGNARCYSVPADWLAKQED